MKPKRKLPPWLKRKLPASGGYNHTSKVLADLKLQTICTHANCPNQGQCWERGTATVLILGNICTRNCKFCSVGTGKPLPPDPTEPQRVADMSKQMQLKYLVITSVDRDDLEDGGASHFRDVVNQSRAENPDMRFELLVPDFRNCQEKALEILESALPFVFGHNIETVPSLYSVARPGGDYKLSLDLLEMAKKRWPETPTKSSMMLGLGEKEDQVIQTLKDLRNVSCDRISMGQYLKPSKESLDVVEYVTPEKFDFWAEKAKELGFKWVMASPFTRSSYHAEKE
jgi:lipoic acid synthetase